jgi:O-acetyl-ADP-ribose deacetylase (regulator of RNase III)
VTSLRDVCLEQGITKIGMPQIGCGLDRLKWDKVKAIIAQTFENTEIEIVVCSL